MPNPSRTRFPGLPGGEFAPFSQTRLYRARDCVAHPSIREEVQMTVHFAIMPLLALIAGILILIRPRLLNYVVAIYLIVVGLVGLFPMLR
jgi:hypothetical protein